MTMDSAAAGQLFSLAIIGLVVVFLLFLSVRIVRQYERLVVFRLGRTSQGMVREPGMRFLIPFVDRIVKVDIRERFIEVPAQTVITSDNAPIDIAFLVYYRIIDPLASVVEVSDFDGAVQGIAIPTLRQIVMELSVDDVIAKRGQLDEVIRTSLDEQVEAWGGSVTQVEIREITPPPDVQEAMAQQFAASTPTNRLVELDKAHDAGLITDDEYEAKRQDIVSLF